MSKNKGPRGQTPRTHETDWFKARKKRNDARKKQQKNSRKKNR